MSSLLPFWDCFPTFSRLHYPLTSSLAANSRSVFTDIRPQETIADFVARISKECGLQDQLALQPPGGARDGNKDLASQRAITVYPNPTTVNFGFIPESRPTVEPEAPAGTAEHDLAIHSNTVGNDGKQGNRITYPGSHVGRVKATINGNTCHGKGNQQNHIG